MFSRGSDQSSANILAAQRGDNRSPQGIRDKERGFGVLGVDPFAIFKQWVRADTRGFLDSTNGDVLLENALYFVEAV